MSTEPHNRVVNFGAGPAPLPLSVLEEAQGALLNFNNSGIGIAEISHRSPEFLAFRARTDARIRTQLAVPRTHHILFTQSGASAQFAAAVTNLLARHRLLHPDAAPADTPLDYVVTGTWSARAAAEARRLTAPGAHARVHIAADARTHSPAGAFDGLPPRTAYAFSAAPALVYYCENETVEGVQFSSAPASPGAFPFDALPPGAALVGDYSSSFMSRAIPRLGEHALVYACAQKNVGPAGVTVLLVREDCLVDVEAAARAGALPVATLDAPKTHADARSLYNTPSVFALYVTGLVLAHMERMGGVPYYEALSRRKALKVYAAVREGQERGVCRRAGREGSESWMNVVFTAPGEGAEQRFLDGAKARGMAGIKGHRFVGGIRVSLYNAVTEEHVDKLVEYMKWFIAEETKN
ncbi:phosphoserine aminotransferase [Phanerochaete sordida]|uniref:phosphoserine transaminase n=1 Tax=Phanerochaete sordida TaxID=48140 RepID=A0A9P3GD50_9APHY|nr:phosphoserine aminotransferase [Phanerochaete sordida]